MSATIHYVFAKGGFQTPTDEVSVETMLRTSESTIEGMPSVQMRGFRRGIVGLCDLSLNDLARICEGAGKKLTIQIE